MPDTKADIISRLRREILPLEGLRPLPAGAMSDLGLGDINASFPQGVFPRGAVHEFLSDQAEHAAATAGFMSALTAGLMKEGSAAVWISSTKKIFPPALQQFGINPERILFINLKRDRDILWATEEALKCSGIASVICELKDINFTASRRFQLAVEESRVTGFIHRNHSLNAGNNACIARWKISPLATETENDLPGVGFPRWQIDLLKIRNGKPGTWQMEWAGDQFRIIRETARLMMPVAQRKII